MSPNKKVDQSAISVNSQRVLEARYLKKDAKGKTVETPEELFRRVAHHVAGAERVFLKDNLPKDEADKIVADYEERFYQVMSRLDFLPNSPTLMNAGRDLGQLAGCFVLPVEDSMSSIFQTLKDTAMIHKTGGGTGFSFSKLRARNSTVMTTNGVASGPISFMNVYNRATEEVKQGGTRRGANMGILRIDHPDIEEFIACKADKQSMKNFNLSVAITDEFMEAVAANSNFVLRNPKTGKRARTVKAKKLFDDICRNAWETGDPGLIFIDIVNKDNPLKHLGLIESTNPCGEIPLLPYEVCNLGSIVLSNYTTDTLDVDYDRLKADIYTDVRIMDNIVEVNKYPLPEIKRMARLTRRIGLGVMGWADLLVTLKIRYDSDEAIALADEMASFIHKHSIEASVQLAKERGPFGAWEGSDYQKAGMPPQRNVAVNTVAPTGSISMIADCSSGIEPHFAPVYIKEVIDNKKFYYAHKALNVVLKERDIYSDEILERIIEEGSLKNISEIPKEFRELLVAAHDISPEWHIRMQATWQKHVDNAISKTINLPNSADLNTIGEAYLLAYKLGCKGTTVFRDGCLSQQVLYTKKGEKDEKKKEGTDSNGYIYPRPRPEIATGITQEVRTGEGSLFITLNRDAIGLCEMFATIGKAGGSESAYTEAISRLVSLCLRSNIDPIKVTHQLRGIAGPRAVWHQGEQILSVPDALGRALKLAVDYPKEKNKLKADEPTKQIKSIRAEARDKDVVDTQCASCGYPRMRRGEGRCLVCPECGYSSCG